VRIVLGVVLFLPAGSCAHAQQHAKNTANVDVRTFVFDRTANREVDPVWKRMFTKEDAAKAFRPGMARYAMIELKCAVAADGSLKACQSKRDPDLPSMQSYYRMIEKSFVLSPAALRRTRPDALTVHIDVQTANSAGVETSSYPCLPAFCTSTPPPPPPPG